MPAQKQALDPGEFRSLSAMWLYGAFILMLPAVFEIHDTSGKIRCKECFEAGPHTTGWMVRNSHKRHLLQSREHEANVVANKKCREAAAADHTEYHSIYSTQTFANFNAGPSAITVTSRPALFDLGDEMHDSNENAYDPFYEVIPSADVTPLVRNPGFEQERLWQEVELLLADAEHADLLGRDEDDATVTNIEDDFADLGADNLIDVMPHCLSKMADIQSDDEQIDPFIEIGTDGEYWPYPNRLVSPFWYES